ncbi:RNA polymerase sigma factor [Bailinhaonella thermotolerans]|uniref:RNA polymerase sigma factor n=1 Tax=Bailinhaonella thermotolerans TaxID=1070861 RepID=A0A3A4AL19_9ACTN|nr:RNA polymerase sigma factor [Bailinhaonella thermotolerans]RJL27197.1 RNA polymerase sigma factor [Bailinhaonella thermotolerans]
MRPTSRTPGAFPPQATEGAPDDAEILARSRREPERFAEIFHRHAAPIKRYVTRRLGPDVAEDVVAETFLIAFRQRSGYDTSRPDARPWLYGIAANLIGRHRRTELRQLQILARTGDDPVCESFTDRSDSRVSADAVRRRLAAALAGLAPEYREALLLVTWGGLGYEDAARALNVPIGTIRSRISRARSKLRAALGGVDPTSASEESHG